MKLFQWFTREQRGARAKPETGEPTVRVLKDAAADAQKSRLPQMAAALSYRTIFGLLPVLAIGLVFLHRIASAEQMASLIRTLIELAGLQNIVVDTSAMDAGVLPGGVGAGAEMMGPPMPMAANSLDQWINDLVSRINNINFQAIGIVGVVMLMYAAITMIVEVERAFNQIFRVPRGRSWARRLTNYTTLLVYGPLCIFLTFYLDHALAGWIQSVSERGTGASAWVIALQTLGQSMQLLISVALAVVLYTVVPNTKVRFWPAFIGGLLAALLFEAGKYGFATYVQFSAKASYARLYGSLALVPLFLLWVYFTWIIVLFGLQVTYQLQYGRGKAKAMPMSEYGPAVVDPAAGVVVLSNIARGFATGQVSTQKSMALGTGLSENAILIVLDRLVSHGLVHKLERPDAPAAESGYVLGRSPGSIRIGEILSIGFEISGGPEGSEVLERLRKAQIDAAGDQTLADISGLSSDAPAKIAPGGLANSRDQAGALIAAQSPTSPKPATLL